jgi:hypothetical protein
MATADSFAIKPSLRAALVQSFQGRISAGALLVGLSYVLIQFAQAARLGGRPSDLVPTIALLLAVCLVAFFAYMLNTEIRVTGTELITTDAIRQTKRVPLRAINGVAWRSVRSSMQAWPTRVAIVYGKPDEAVVVVRTSLWNSSDLDELQHRLGVSRRAEYQQVTRKELDAEFPGARRNALWAIGSILLVLIVVFVPLLWSR